MNSDKLKEILKKELAIFIMDTLCPVIKIIDKFSKEEVAFIRFYKVKTKNHHVRIIIDHYFDVGILVKPRGFLKEWKFINERDLPRGLAGDIFSDSCTEENRKRLVSKLMELKAFW